MKITKYTFFSNISLIVLFAFSLSSCSKIVDALKGGSNPSPSQPPTETRNGNKSSNGKTLQDDKPSPSDSPSGQVQTKADALRQMNCREPSEGDYIYGAYQVGWTARGDRYEGVLKVNGDVGQMRIKFFNAASNSEDLVDQTMVLANCPKGLILLGLNPRIPDTDKQHSTYSADNILIRRETNGSTTLVVVDDQGVISPLEIQKLSNN